MVIVGSGECGTRAACELRRQGWTGSITLVGAEDEMPYERPQLSKSVLSSTVLVSPTPICSADDLGSARIEFIKGVAVSRVDPKRHHVVLADHRRIGYERLLLATGAFARRISERQLGSVHYLRSRRDAVALRNCLHPDARIVIVGGGFIGMEVAASARARGCAVTVVEIASQPMNRVVPTRVADLVTARHEQEGVRLRCQTSIVSWHETGEHTAVVLSNGETLICDVVLVAIGAAPDTALARQAGLAVDNGIRVDSRLRTSEPDIFAAGDCCSFPHPLYDDRQIRLECWHNAQDQGRTVAQNMLDRDRPFLAVPRFWSDQYDLTVRIAGLPDRAAREVVRRRADGVDIHFDTAPGGRLLAASAVGVGNAVAKDLRLAEILIAKRVQLDPLELADGCRSLKSILRSTVTS